MCTKDGAFSVLLNSVNTVYDRILSKSIMLSYVAYFFKKIEKHSINIKFKCCFKSLLSFIVIKMISIGYILNIYSKSIGTLSLNIFFHKKHQCSIYYSTKIMVSIFDHEEDRGKLQCILDTCITFLMTTGTNKV